MVSFRRVTARTLAATALAMGGVVMLTATPAEADVLVGACNVVSNPDATTHTECGGLDLSGQVFSGLDLRFANFTGSNLSGADFSNTVLANGNFTGSNAAGANFNSADLDGADFTGANVAGATIVGASVGPDDISLTSPDGSPVSYTLPAVGNNLTRDCGPAGPFEVGSTTVSCTVTIAGSTDSASASFVVTVTAEMAPVITGPATFLATVGTAETYTPTTLTGSPAPTVSATGLPSGLTIAPSTGVISGTPATGSGGLYDVVLTATNDTSPDAALAVTLTVQEPTAITGAPTASFTVGEAGTYTPATVTGFPAPVFSAAGLPNGLVIDPITGAITGTPGSGAAGAFDVIISADNGVGTPASFALRLTVAPAAGSTVGGGDSSGSDSGGGSDDDSDSDSTDQRLLPDTGGLGLGLLLMGLSLVTAGTLLLETPLRRPRRGKVRTPPRHRAQPAI